MWNYVLTGIVHPERAALDMGDKLDFDMGNASAGIGGHVTLSIFKNQVTVGFAAKDEVTDLHTLRNVVTDVVSGVVDIVGLDAVVGYEVEIRSVHSVQRQDTLVFGVDIPGLSIGEKELRSIDILPLFRLVGGAPLFRRALSDFKGAIRHPADTGFLCYRAVESLINYVRADKNINDKKAAIAELDRALNLDPSCIQLLRELGGEVRHGNVVWISGEDRTRAIKVAREIIVRFAAYIGADPKACPTFELFKP